MRHKAFEDVIDELHCLSKEINYMRNALSRGTIEELCGLLEDRDNLNFNIVLKRTINENVEETNAI